MSISFVETRSRSTDGETSKEAARNASNNKAAGERIKIARCIAQEPMTAREVSNLTGIDYHTTQRRISEAAGIFKTTEKRDGCFVWAAL